MAEWIFVKFDIEIHQHIVVLVTTGNLYEDLHVFLSAKSG
jgi:hypothetical protein